MFHIVLRYIRRKYGLSQQKLAKLSGIDPSLVCRYESGQRHPSRESLLALVAVLQPSPEDTKLLFHAAGYLAPEEVTLVAETVAKQEEVWHVGRNTTGTDPSSLLESPVPDAVRMVLEQPETDGAVSRLPEQRPR